ncbi:hypothetical protein MY10362_004601 [Beauveria mimosiformis]
MHFTQLISAAALAEPEVRSPDLQYEGQRFDISKLVSCVTVPQSLRGETSSFKIHDSRISCSFYSDTQCRNELVADVEEDEPDLREIGAHDNLDSVKCREK